MRSSRLPFFKIFSGIKGLSGKKIYCLAAFAGLFLFSCESEKISEDSLITEGRALFRNKKFSINHDQSCETCHPQGHMDNRKWHFPAIHGLTNSVPDSFRTLTLWGVVENGPPYLWTGNRASLEAVSRLYTDTIMGGGATQDEIDALVAYQKSLVFPDNPWRNNDGSYTAAQSRGKKIYETKGFCSPCHPAPKGTNGFMKDIGTGGIFKTPGLRAMFSEEPYFHDGRAKTLKDVINFYVADTSGAIQAGGHDIDLSENEKNDLLEYLRTF